MLADMFIWKTNFQDAGEVIALLAEATERSLHGIYRDRSVVRLPARGKLVMTGDLHDHAIHLEKILNYARLDESADHHVYFHELIHGENLVNGMDFSHRMLLRMAELMCRYPDQVHPMLANHEISQFSQAGVSKGAGDQVQLFNDAVEWAFQDDAEEVSAGLYRFLRSWPLAIMAENGIMAAHSLPAERVMSVFDAGILKRDLVEDDFTPRTGSAYMLVWGRHHSPEHLERLAELFGVKAFCLGHEHAENGYQLVGKNTMVLNSDHERGAILAVDLSEEPACSAWPWSVIPLGALPVS